MGGDWIESRGRKFGEWQEIRGSSMNDRSSSAARHSLTDLISIRRLGSYRADRILGITDMRMPDGSRAYNVVTGNFVGEMLHSRSRVHGDNADSIVRDQLTYHQFMGDGPVDVKMYSTRIGPNGGLVVVVVKMRSRVSARFGQPAHSG